MAIDKKEERQKRKDQRQKSKIDKYKAGLKDQPDVNIGPLGSERKAEIDKRVSDFADGELKEGLKKFQGLYKAPDVNIPDKPTYEPTIKDVRKAKRAKIADILGALGSGLKGQKVDPTMFRDRLDRKRSEDYLKYKDIATKGKKQLDTWSNKYMQDQLDYLKGLRKTETSPLKQQKIEAEIKKLESETRATDALAEQRKRKKSTSSSKGPYPTYEYKTGDGQTIKIPMPGDEGTAKRLNNALESTKKVKEARDKIQAEMDNSIYRAEKEGWFGKSKAEVQEDLRQQYADKLQQANDAVAKAEIDIKSIFEGSSEEVNNDIEKKVTTEQKEEVDPWEL